MADPLLSRAERVIGLFGLHPFIQKNNDDLRRKLFLLYGAGDIADFLNEGIVLASAVIQVGVSTREGYSAVIRELTDQYEGDKVRANRKAAQLVLLFILHESVCECTRDTESWRAMEVGIRTMLFDPNIIPEDTISIVRNDLHFGQQIEAYATNLRATITEAYREHLDGAQYSISGIVACVDTYLFKYSTQKEIDIALRTLHFRIGGDRSIAREMLILYGVYITLVRFLEEKQSVLTEACVCFKDQVLDRISVIS